MRVNPDPYTAINGAIQQNEASLQTALQRLSSGKQVSLPSDNPVAFSQDLRSLDDASAIDRYTKSARAALSQTQVADSALSSVVTSLTRALSLGTEGGDGTLTNTQRVALSQQVQSIFSDVLAVANTTSSGVALFAGTSTTSTPFVQDASAADGALYQGSDGTNTVQVGEGFSVVANVPGDQIFASGSGSVLGSLQQLATALQSGDRSDLATATAAVSSAIAHVGQVRSVYASTAQQLTTQTDYLSQESVSLTTQQSSLVDADIATTATQVTQAQTALSAVYAAAAKILPNSLLNYLQN